MSFNRLGWTCTFVDPLDPENFKNAINFKTKAIFIEVLANPGGVVVDLEAIVSIAKDGIPLIVDNTLATPYLCQPFHWGADLIVHSTTKFLSGHGTFLGGALVESGKFDWAQNEKFPTMTEPDPAYHGLTFAETFGDFGFTMKARAVGYVIPAVAAKCLLHHHRHGDPTSRMDRHIATPRPWLSSWMATRA